LMPLRRNAGCKRRLCFSTLRIKPQDERWEKRLCISKGCITVCASKSMASTRIVREIFFFSELTLPVEDSISTFLNVCDLTVSPMACEAICQCLGFGP
jgi:hypothetical protein